jgi:hypothetical protein
VKARIVKLPKSFGGNGGLALLGHWGRGGGGVTHFSFRPLFPQGAFCSLAQKIIKENRKDVHHKIKLPEVFFFG